VRWVVAHPGPSYSVHDLYVGWVEALRAAGQHVIEFNLDDRLTVYSAALRQVGTNMFAPMLTAEQAYELAADGLNSTLYKSWPDILFVISGFFIPVDTLERARRSRTRVVLLHSESPYQDQMALKLAPYVDLMLVDDPTNIDRFAEVCKVAYMPKAYRPSVHRPGPAVAELECDLAFVGTGFPSRVEFFERMNLDGLDVLLGGNWTGLPEDSPLRPHLAHDAEQCLGNELTADVYRSARVGLNLYRREGETADVRGWSMGPRELEMAACGLFFLRDPRGEGDEVLDMLPAFTSPEEASDLLRYWLSRRSLVRCPRSGPAAAVQQIRRK
jgi:spore maturation protein CgeB